MPKGITKALFNKFVKYYDADVFIEAGKIIRRQVKELDKADPLERVEKLLKFSIPLKTLIKKLFLLLGVSLTCIWAKPLADYHFLIKIINIHTKMVMLLEDGSIQNTLIRFLMKIHKS